MEVGEVEAQAVAGGCTQGPALLLVVGILPWEAGRRQAPKHGLGPLRAGGCGYGATQQTQEDQQPHGAPVPLARPDLDLHAVSPLICLSNTWP